MKICCDAGSTSVRFALADDDHEIYLRKKYPIRDFPGGETGLLAALMRYMNEHDVSDRIAAVDRFVISAAGPLNNNEIKLTNSDWVANTNVIQSGLQDTLDRDVSVSLLNDFEALAYGLSVIKPSEIETIRSREPEGKMRLVCGAGTGLGLAGLLQAGPLPSDIAVIPTEGGHQTFSDETPTERELRNFILDEWISYECILSGDGLQILYDFFAQRNSQPHVTELSPEQIIKRYNDGNVSARQTLESFALILGGFCGNMVLALGGTGGVYLWGGILKEFPLELLKRIMVRRFQQRGRASNYVANVPIYRIISGAVALRGCSVFQCLLDRR